MPSPSLHDADGTVRVLLADDHSVVRNELARILDAQPDMEVVGQAQDGRAAIELTRKLRPDAVLMDINMPELDGIEATRKLANEMPEIRVIGLSMHDGDELAATIIEAGASAYISKSSPFSLLLDKMRGWIGVTIRA